MHVDGTGVLHHPGADALDHRAGQPGPAGGAQHELGGVDAAGEVQQRGGHVVADHGVERRADVFGQPAQPGSAPTGAPTRPSPRNTCTANSSAEPERLAMRAARRSTVSLSGPPVIATTTRSRVSHTSVTRWSVR